MLPVSSALAQFVQDITYWVVVPHTSRRHNYSLHVIVLVKPNTPSLTRRHIRQSLRRTLTSQVLFDQWVGSQRQPQAGAFQDRLIVHVRNDKRLA